jgi:hypothetical protein
VVQREIDRAASYEEERDKEAQQEAEQLGAGRRTTNSLSK